ncbi:YkvA family protein [Aliamphritea hakodatensis]|uniref:YkvA family protein n=1 Tax=Aliamphritea hakodatensis TaxID=2895352 RepID=UPI0022FDA0D4|nr:YkvA family protein [Aliamphritea hakodatensis]
MANPPAESFSHDSFWNKLKDISHLEDILHEAILLYVLLTDADVPVWAKAIVISALVYLIDPIDAMPDILPLVGYLDDLAVITAALKALHSQVWPHHHAQAEQIYQDL